MMVYLIISKCTSFVWSAEQLKNKLKDYFLLVPTIWYLCLGASDCFLP
jgi:hypothetical protein